MSREEFIEIFKLFEELEIRKRQTISDENITNYLYYWAKIRGYYRSTRYENLQINKSNIYKNIFRIKYIYEEGKTSNTVVIFLSEYHSPVELLYYENKTYVIYSRDGFTRELFEINRENRIDILNQILDTPDILLSKIPVPIKYNPFTYTLELQGEYGVYSFKIIFGMMYIFQDGKLKVNYLNIFSYKDFLDIFNHMECKDNQMYFDAVDGLMMLNS